MAEKSFRQILDEKRTIERRPVDSSKTSAAPLKEPFWLDFQVTAPASSTRRSTKAYPQAPRKVRPVEIDPTVEINGFSSEQCVALQILGMKSEGKLSRRELKASYRRLAQKLHPDCHPAGIAPAQREILTQRFRDTQEAYSLLITLFR